MPSIFAANESSVTIDGAPVAGVRGIEYRQQRARAGVYALGSPERIGIVSGPQAVEVRLRFASTCPELDGVDPASSVSIIALLRHGSQQMTVRFDECFMLEKGFEMGVGAHGEAVYTLTATRMVEELGQASAAAAG